ncbi:6,7-dimethyl-8-ribityllumazine synthase [bacterium]|nr:6,7-dimethyl-8-ribityllumazine synthase [bacterium]MDA7916992.1 6,7-dimethyl-8-ribityllumazine synthase [Akkermansiaceae bacterium]MDA7519884.1 6,7-dimethyl-8-ribityllumazine synthase [bacterium]MDA7936150.1 6,7-dimethyl-8-ribityllumazine synthase [bacterium]MDB4316860.1 6,7-dimethyl-8-ribityllumazine synthase [Akkermansiaceae bacterium]
MTFIDKVESFTHISALMSAIIPPRPRVISTGKIRISIVAAKFNEEFTDALVENVVDEIGLLADNPKVDLVRVPGAFEIPVAVKSILKEEEPDCVIALGCIIRGGTGHADLVATSVTNGLQQLALEFTVPIIHEVLLVEDEKQAYARCIGEKLNRGREAARSALEIITVMGEINGSTQSLRLHPSNA